VYSQQRIPKKKLNQNTVLREEGVLLAVDMGLTEAKEVTVWVLLAVMDMDLLEAKEPTVWALLAVLDSDMAAKEVTVLVLLAVMDSDLVEAKEDMILEVLAVMDTGLLEAKEETVWEALAVMNMEVLHSVLCLLHCVTLGKLDAVTMRYVVRWTLLEVVFISAVVSQWQLVQTTCGDLPIADGSQVDRPMAHGNKIFLS